MNKNFEMAKVLGTVSLVLGVVASAVYLGFVQYQVASFQFMDGREQIADLVFKSHLVELKIAYVLFLVTIIGLIFTLWFAYRGYKAK